MAIYTSILTGGVSNHETTSEEVNGVYTDFVNEGVVGTVGNSSGVAPATGAFAVNAQGTPDMTVAVSAGVAYVEGVPTSQNAQTFRIKNTGTESVAISANASGSTKYDWVYINLSAANLNAPNSAGDNVATLTTSRSTSASADDGTPPTYGYAIAVVTVANGASTITNGNIRDIRSQVTLDTGITTGTGGWTTLDTILTTATGYNKGNREYELTSSEDLTSTLSPGMRLKVARGTTPPTQCLDLEASSSQYATKASPSGITFTDDFTCEAWVKLESYTGSEQFIVARRNASTEGWVLSIGSDGRIRAGSLRIASNNRILQSYQSVPLGRWVHIAVTMDNSANSHTMYVDGVSVPFENSLTGTVTALVQGTTAMTVGASNTPGSYFDGKIADVRVWSAVRTATEIRDNMNQQLVGNESNLVAYFKLDGDLNDSTSNANNLTGSGGAAATNSDNPMQSTEYGIVTKVAAGAVTVFTGTDHNIPNGTLSTPQYSQHKAPVGFPSGRNKWRVVSLSATNTAITIPNKVLGLDLSVPTGEWLMSANAAIQFVRSTGTTVNALIAISTSATDITIPEAVGYGYGTGDTQPYGTSAGPVSNVPVTVTTQTTYYVMAGGTTSTVTPTTSVASPTTAFLHMHVAECAYL